MNNPPPEPRDSYLLDRPPPPGYTEEWIQSLKLPFVEETTHLESFFVFRIQNDWLALSSHCIKEVTNATFIHTLPHTNSKILLGIINVQGELLIAISMQNLLGIEIPPDIQMSKQYSRNIVFGDSKNIFVFPVNEIYGLTHITLDIIQPVPISISKSLKNFFSGIFTLPDNAMPIGLLDHKLIINSLNENHL